VVDQFQLNCSGCAGLYVVVKKRETEDCSLVALLLLLVAAAAVAAVGHCAVALMV
jgi:hypothetical protein